MSAELEELFNDWQRSYGADGVSFVRDGFIGADVSTWPGAVPKILFLLKEPHNRNGILAQCEYDLRLLFREPEKFSGNRKTVERTMGRWADALTQASLGRAPRWDLDATGCAAALRSAAVMNLKKLAGGSTSSSRDILAHTIHSRPFIEKELEILAPHVVVCGGTFNIARRGLTGFSPCAGAAGCHIRGGAIWIDHCHPAARVDRDQRDLALIKRYRPSMNR